MLKHCGSINRLLFIVLLFGYLAAVTHRVTIASELQPQPSPSPTPASISIAVIDSMVVNGLKSDSATFADIELLREGASGPEATVAVGDKLLTGDRIRTKDGAQLVLRIPNKETGSDDLLFLDPNSEVGFGSICVLAGRVLAWAGVRFRLCTSWGTLGVEGTEFEVKITPTGEATCLANEGKVKLDPDNKSDLKLLEPARAMIRRLPFLSGTREISPDKGLSLKLDGTMQPVDVTPAVRLQNIDYWSEQIIKVSKPGADVAKAFFNYSGDTQVEEFKKARREALVNNSSTAYFTMGKVLNDWNNGAAAQKSFVKVKDDSLRKSPEYMVNVAEAERLQGNTAAAEAQLKKTIEEHPDFAPIYYVAAKVSEQKIANDPVGKANEAAQIRKNLAQALVLQSGESYLKGSIVEADLDKTIQTNGTESLTRYSWLAPGNEWLGGGSQTGHIMAFGNASIQVGHRSATGRAELVAIGNQFKLKVDNEIFTGSIVGNKNAGGISYAMQFDNVGAIGHAVLSVTGRRTGRGFTLFAARQPAGSFSFTAERVF